MINTFTGKNGEFFQITSLSNLQREFATPKPAQYYTMIWNPAAETLLEIDDLEHPLDAQSMVPLSPCNFMRIDVAGEAIAIRFNAEFYCVLKHDNEVSCAGLLFYGTSSIPHVPLDAADNFRLKDLLRVIVEEFKVHDNIQLEMLQMLLKRWIIIATRLIRGQLHCTESDPQLDIIRKFNVAVEMNYRTKHKVADYAAMLNKSPKTLSNIFSKIIDKTPRDLIQERILLEAKRLLLYTDKTVKEVAMELGFDEASNFARFFKNMTANSPAEFKKLQLQAA